MPGPDDRKRGFNIEEMENWNVDRTVDYPVMVRGLMGKDSGGTWRYFLVDSSGRLTISVSGSSVGGFTAGSVIFAGATGFLTEDNTNFFWDDTNNRIGIGTNSPTSDFHLKKTLATDVTLNFSVEAVGDAYPTFNLSRSGGSSYTNRTWNFSLSTAGEWLFRDETAGLNRAFFDTNGALNIAQNYTGAADFEVLVLAMDRTNNAASIYGNSTGGGNVSPMIRIGSNSATSLNSLSANDVLIAQKLESLAAVYANTTVNIGKAGTSTGKILISGSTSGTITIQPANAAGTYTLTLPTDDGGAGQFLKTDGSGVLTWDSPAGSGDVVGPSGATDSAVALFDGTTGKLLKDSTIKLVTTVFSPVTNDGVSLGSGLLKWSDLFLASGGIIDFNNGDITITHAANNLLFAGASSGYTFDAKIYPTSNDGAALGDTTHQFSDLFLAEGGVINWDNGDATMTQTGNDITVAGITTFGVGTSTAVTLGSIELGHASDTTISRVSAGVVAIEGVNIETTATTANSKIASVGITIDGGGSAITTGVKGYIEVPYACTINRATLLADQSGSIVVDVWKDTYANYPPTVADTITASAKPTISTATKSQDSTLTGWTTSVAAGDILGFNVDSATTVTRVHLILKVTKT